MDKRVTAYKFGHTRQGKTKWCEITYSDGTQEWQATETETRVTEGGFMQMVDTGTMIYTSVPRMIIHWYGGSILGLDGNFHPYELSNHA